jgi:hypothetical protein
MHTPAREVGLQGPQMRVFGLTFPKNPNPHNRSVRHQGQKMKRLLVLTFILYPLLFSLH